MNIGIDGRELLGRPTGVGRFLSELLRVWSADASLAHRFTLFVPGSRPPVAYAGPNVSVVVDEGQPPGTWWEQTRLARLAADARIDVLVSPGYTAPLRLRCPSLVVVHDVSFFAHPEWFGWREGLRRRWLTKASARRARVVVTVSEFSAREIGRYLGVEAARVRIVRHGSPPGGGAADEAREPRILFVGSIFNRRHIPELIAAFTDVAPRIPEARLILVGDNRTSPRLDPAHLARQSGFGDRIEWRDYVTDEDLAQLYGAARAFVFLSDYEGFAMTPLEAIAHGVPPVLLDTAVSHEVYGDAARYVPLDVNRIGDTLMDVLTNESTRSALLARGRELLTRYTWTKAAGDMLTAIEDATR